MKKIILIIAAMLLIYLNIFSQSSNWAWAKRFGEGSHDFLYSIATDAKGNVYIAGNFGNQITNVGSLKLSIGEYGGIFFAKLDVNGNVLWAKSAIGEGNSNGKIYSITTDASGNIYLAGGFTGTTMTFGSTILKKPGMFLLKCDENGNVLWAKNEGKDNKGDYGTYDMAYSVVADPSSNIYVTASFDTTVTFGSVTLNSGVFLLKFDINGNLLFGKNLNGCWINSITADVFGNVYVAGAFSETSITLGTTTLTNKNISKDFRFPVIAVFITKLDPAGNILWAKSAEGTKSDEATSVTTDASGNVYLAGNFKSTALSFG